MIYLLHEAMRASALRTPDRDAFHFHDHRLTYAQLAVRASQLAGALRAHGIGKSDRVGIFLDKSLETAIAVHGIMQAGGVYVPLDPRSPVERLVNIVEDCALSGIVTQDSKAAVIDAVAQAAPMLRFVIGTTAVSAPQVRSVGWDEVGSYPESFAYSPRMSELDLAYIMYTSGSTGKPKGMMHTHGSGLAYARMSTALYGVTPDDRLGNHSPLHFDMSTFEYLTGPYVGSLTVVIPEAHTLFPVNMAQLIEAERLTFWYSVPFALIQLLTKGMTQPRDFTAMRWVLYGGEPFPLHQLRDLMALMPNARISNVYGPAETNQISYYTVPPASEWTDEFQSVPIGTVCDNGEALILDDADQPAAPGVIGELVYRAPTMMQGYWNRPDLNARAFYRREPVPGYTALYYRTGDLVQMRPDGLMEFLGRKDHQVKIRGFRVELTEIDHALIAHAAVEQGAVFVVPSADGDSLAAAVMLRAGMEVSADALIALLSQRLPTYAVPRTIYFMDALPRTSTGKIDRKALYAAAVPAPSHPV